MIEIKTATTIHLDALNSLFEQYRLFCGADKNTRASSRFLKQRIKHKDSIILLAFMNQEPAGFVQVFPSFSSIALQTVWVLNDLFVTDSFRRKGIAKKLVAAVEKKANSENIFSVRLSTRNNNREAQSLYSVLGYTLVDDFCHYSKRL